MLAPHAFFQPRAPPGLLSSRVSRGLNVYHTRRRVVLPNAPRTDAIRDPHCLLHLSSAGQPRAFRSLELPLEEADEPDSAERAGGSAGIQGEKGAAGGEGEARTGALPREPRLSVSLTTLFLGDLNRDWDFVGTQPGF